MGFAVGADFPHILLPAIYDYIASLFMLILFYCNLYSSMLAFFQLFRVVAGALPGMDTENKDPDMIDVTLRPEEPPSQEEGASRCAC